MPTWNHRSMDVSTVSRANRRTSPLAVAISNSMPRIRYNASILTASFVAIAFLTYATGADRPTRSEEHTSELQSLMRISYAVFCLKKKKKDKININKNITTDIIYTIKCCLKPHIDI